MVGQHFDLFLQTHLVTLTMTFTLSQSWRSLKFRSDPETFSPLSPPILCNITIYGRPVCSSFINMPNQILDLVGSNSKQNLLRSVAIFPENLSQD
jgi:hypothetical protein